VTHECDHPPDSVRSLPRLTSNALPNDGAAPRDVDTHIRAARHEGSSIYNLDASLLAELDPDLVVTQELCAVCAVAYETVRGAVRRLPGEIPILSLEPRTLDDIVDTVAAVGAAAGRERDAALLMASMRERIAAIASLATPDPKPRVACIEWTDPIFAGGHWVPDLVAVAGGEDVLGSAGEPSREVVWDRVIEAAPDVMVLMPCGYGLERTLELAPEVTSRPGFAALPCARDNRVVAVDGSSYFNRPGPRIVDGLEMLAAAIRSRPGDPLPRGAAWV